MASIHKAEPLKMDLEESLELAKILFDLIGMNEWKGFIGHQWKSK